MRLGQVQPDYPPLGKQLKVDGRAALEANV
jgi:hypothetical protein